MMEGGMRWVCVRDVMRGLKNKGIHDGQILREAGPTSAQYSNQ